MIYLTILNTAVLLYLLVKMGKYSLEFRIERTRWSDIPMAIEVWFMKNHAGYLILNIPIHRAVSDLDDWHMHKLIHHAKGCEVGANYVRHTDACSKEHDCQQGMWCGNMTWTDSEREWNRQHLKPREVA